MLLTVKCIIAIPILALSLAQKSAREPDAAHIKELTRLEYVSNDAHVRGDASALDQLWDDDLVVTVPDMPVMNKDESLAIGVPAR